MCYLGRLCLFQQTLSQLESLFLSLLLDFVLRLFQAFNCLNKLFRVGLCKPEAVVQGVPLLLCLPSQAVTGLLAALHQSIQRIS